MVDRRCDRSLGSRRRPIGAGDVSRLPHEDREGVLVRIVAIANQKGGCGKTTVAINLAASLAREARRTLLVDLDPQGHCALGTAVPEDQIDLSILDCLLRQIESAPIELSQVTWQIAPNLDLAPSRADLATLEPRLGDRDNVDVLLRDLLRLNESRYDYVVIDCPPHLGLLMKNGLRAATEVIIPVDTGYFSLHGLTRQLATIEELGQRNGSKPAVRVLPNQYDVRTKLAREILSEMRKRFDGVVLESIVNFNTKLKEGASFGQPITEFAPTSMGAKDFQSLAREVLANEPQVAPGHELLEHMERLAADAERLLATTTTLVRPESTDVDAAQATTEKTVSFQSPALKAAVEESLRRRTSTPASDGSSATVRSPVRFADSDPARPTEGTLENQSVVTTPSAQRQVGMTESLAATSPPRVTPAKTPVQNDSPLPLQTNPATKATPASTISTDNVEPASVMPPPTRAPQDPSSGRAASAPATHDEITRKIDAIYGVRQEGDVVVFRSPSKDASEIQIAGDFNDWMPHTTPMRRLGNGDFEVRLKLPRGRFRYRLVVDGRWSHDAYNPAVESNEYGELNSVVEVNP